jgi:hypothetical protein
MVVPMELYELTDFLKLSATLNLQLSSEEIGWENILQIITNRHLSAHSDEHRIIRDVLAYLDHAYGPRRRRIGPRAILHPLRATALLTQAIGHPQLLDMLTELLHDKNEDLTPETIGQAHFEQVESEFRSLLREIDPTDKWYLMERLDFLTLRKDESYPRYINRLLDRASKTAELVRVKLADRLDNTLDLRITLEDPLEGVNFFQIIFQVLFPPSGTGYHPLSDHPLPSPLNGAKRLYQLFKNAILLSTIREKNVARDDTATVILFGALALASMYEAQRIALHIMGYHQTEIDKQRALLMEAQRYAQEGGMTRTTVPNGEHPLDGLFMTFFLGNRVIRDQRLTELYDDKDLMLQAAVAFVVVFLNFAYTSDFRVRGICDFDATMH